MKKTQYGTKAAGKKLRKSSSKPEHKQGYSVQKPVQKKRSQKPEQGKVTHHETFMSCCSTSLHVWYKVALMFRLSKQ